MSSSALARAVRDAIRALADFRDRQVTAEVDERAPSRAGDLHVIVWPGGTEQDETNETSGCVLDKLFGINVSIAMRAPRKARDHQGEFWIQATDSFDTYAATIVSVVHFVYAVNTTANATILSESGSAEGFIEPLKCTGIGPIREAPPDIFADDPRSQRVAFIRTINFRGARRIQTL
jgi:hypothetical protein